MTIQKLFIKLEIIKCFGRDHHTDKKFIRSPATKSVRFDNEKISIDLRLVVIIIIMRVDSTDSFSLLSLSLSHTHTHTHARNIFPYRSSLLASSLDGTQSPHEAINVNFRKSTNTAMSMSRRTYEDITNEFVFTSLAEPSSSY